MRHNAAYCREIQEAQAFPKLLLNLPTAGAAHPGRERRPVTLEPVGNCQKRRLKTLSTEDSQLLLLL